MKVDMEVLNFSAETESDENFAGEGGLHETLQSFLYRLVPAER